MATARKRSQDYLIIGVSRSPFNCEGDRTGAHRHWNTCCLNQSKALTSCTHWRTSRYSGRNRSHLPRFQFRCCLPRFLAELRHLLLWDWLYSLLWLLLRFEQLLAGCPRPHCYRKNELQINVRINKSERLFDRQRPLQYMEMHDSCKSTLIIKCVSK